MSTRSDARPTIAEGGRWLRPLWCTAVGMVGNLVLTGGKLIVGFVFQSTALVADGVHSFSDVVSAIAVLFALRASRRPPDADHPYGHHSFESLGAIAVSGLRCAPPTGSSMMRSITRSFLRSCAVRRSASAASRIFSAFFQRMEAQPSGEITE